MSDPNIVSRFDEIYSSTNRAVLALITAKCKCTADINDIFQETFMELYQVLHKRGTAYVTHEKALVLRIAKRKIARHYSLVERLYRVLPTVSTDGDDWDSDIPDHDSGADSMEDIVIDKLMLDEAKKLLREKPEIVKKVFYLFYETGHTIPEIARLLSISESNVKHKLYRTLNEIRGLLK